MHRYLLHRSVSISLRDSFLTIDDYGTHDDIDLNFRYLRDNSTSDFHKSSHQRLPNVINTDLNVKPTEAIFLEECDVVRLTWNDGVTTNFCLRDAVPPVNTLVKQFAWNRVAYENHAESLQSEFESVIMSVDGRNSVLERIHKFGIAFVKNCPVDQGSTKQLAEVVGRISPTFFGSFWEFTSDGAFGDTAYTTDFLRAHTDTSYFESPAGIQVFHCLNHDGRTFSDAFCTRDFGTTSFCLLGTGGETLLVDGFNAAKELKREHPDAYQILSSTHIAHRYLEHDKRLYRAVGPLILENHPHACYDDQSLRQIRYNDYDRDTRQSLTHHEQEQFYYALQKFARIIQSPDNELWVKLTPGTVVFIDNWRVLHGRSSFTGSRTMCGCYLDRDTWRNRARMAGILL